MDIARGVVTFALGFIHGNLWCLIRCYNIFVSLARLLSASFFVIFRASIEFFTSKVKMQEVLHAIVDGINDTRLFAGSVAGVVLFYPITCLLVTAVFYAIQAFAFDTFFPRCYNIFVSLARLLSASFFVIFRASIEFFTSKVKMQEVLHAIVDGINDTRLFAGSVAGVALFYPITCLLVTAVFYAIQALAFDTFFPRTNTRRTDRMEKAVHFTIRGFTSLVMACALPFFTKVHPWFNPFMLQRAIPLSTPVVLSLYFQLQIGFTFFKIVGYRPSASTVVFEMTRSLHIFFVALLNPLWSATSAPPPAAIFVMFCYFDIVDAIESFKRSDISGRGPVFVSWRALGYIWLVLRILIPMYGVYQNGFGWFFSYLIFGVIIFAQLILWAIIPSNEWHPMRTSRRKNTRQKHE